MRVDFYILPGADAAARETFCCRLTEKAYQQGHRVHVRTGGREQAESLNQRLWTFRAGSFVPHALTGEATAEDPVVLGDDAPAAGADVLINMAPELPASWQGYERIAEIVNQEPTVLANARSNYRQFRDAGIEPTNHRIQGA